MCSASTQHKTTTLIDINQWMSEWNTRMKSNNLRIWYSFCIWFQNQFTLISDDIDKISVIAEKKESIQSTNGSSYPPKKNRMWKICRLLFFIRVFMLFFLCVCDVASAILKAVDFCKSLLQIRRRFTNEFITGERTEREKKIEREQKLKRYATHTCWPRKKNSRERAK